MNPEKSKLKMIQVSYKGVNSYIEISQIQSVTSREGYGTFINIKGSSTKSILCDQSPDEVYTRIKAREQ